MSKANNASLNMKLNISSSRIDNPEYIEVDPATVSGSHLPYEDNSIYEIISLDLLDKLSLSEAIIFLKECRRILVNGGDLKLRILDLDKLIEKYIQNNFHTEKPWIKSRGEMFNYFLREEGHQWTYNLTEIERLSEFTGYNFTKITESLSEKYRKDEPNTATEDLSLSVSLHKIESEEAEQSPLVSIIIGAYNCKYFKEALESATYQTYENIEIIICDDSAKDDIKVITDTFIDDVRIKYYRNENNLGERLNYSKGLEISRGSYIKFLHDDDILEPRCVEKLLAMFHHDPSITVATSLRKRIDADSNPLPDNMATSSILPQTCIIEGTSALNLLLRAGINYIGEPSTVLIRRKDLLKIKPHYYDFAGYTAYGAGDVAMFLNLLSKGNLAYITEQLSCFRDHDEQTQKNPAIHSAGVKTWNILRTCALRTGLLHSNQVSGLFHKTITQTSWQTFDYSGQMPDLIEMDKNHDKKNKGGQITNYREWKKNTEFKDCDLSFFTHVIAQQSELLNFQFVIPYKGDEGGYLADTIDAIGEQIYPHWSLSVIAEAECLDPIFEKFEQLQWIDISSNNNKNIQIDTLKNVNSDWIIILPAGSKPEKAFLYFLYLYALNYSAWKFIYTDEVILESSDNVYTTLFKPDCNLDMLRSSDYLGNGCAVDTEALINLLSHESFDISSNYDIFLRIYDTYGKKSIGHIQTHLFNSRRISDQVLIDQRNEYNIRVLKQHFKRNNIECTVSRGMADNTHFVQYKLSKKPMISIIIPTKNNGALLQRCIKSIYDKTDYNNYEIIIIDNKSDDPQTLSYLEMIAVSQVNIKVIPYTKPFNYSAINNFAVKNAAKGEFILLLNDDTEILQDSWLERMLQLAQNHDSGAVGARLVFENQKIQHAGVVMGLNDIAHHPGINEDLSESGYMGRYQIVQNFSAVTAACLLISKDKFLKVGGFDEKHLKVLFNDVDLCLKLTEAGYRNIWTPYVTLIHHGSSSLSKKKSKKEIQKSLARAKNERQTMMRRWGTAIANDPQYNRNLSLDYLDYRLDPVYSVPWDPEIIDRPKLLALKSRSDGSSHYRITAPLEKLRNNGRIWHHILPDSSKTKNFSLTVRHIKRLTPDSFLLHSVLPHNLDELKNLRSHTNVALIFGLDDLLTHIPKYNPTGYLLPKNVNIHTLLKNILSLCDRLIVSTKPLHDYFNKKNYINDVAIVPNSLDGNLWLKLNSKNRQDSKLRIGWAGAAQHHGDLAIISEVVKNTHREFNWVFMGMCPEDIKGYLHEFHPAVSFDRYPEKLASLNLDLALAPLEKNKFNEAKSNLRLLEYGILGIPVIATDIFPYQDTPAITVNNDYEKWLKSIREITSDQETMKQIGQNLQKWVQEHYLLENNIDLWSKALIP